jgi:septum formation protein
MQQKSEKESSTLVLASASPRRSKILAGLGVRFEVAVPDVEEITTGDPHETVGDNALRKNAWGAARFPGRWVLTADTVVVFGGRCVEKPVSMTQAWEFLRMLSGQTHEVLTGVALADPSGHVRSEIVTSIVSFRALTDVDIDAYFKLIDPMDKAGAYDVDEYGHVVIASFKGSRTNIMGLPRETVEGWLRPHGELWQ